MREMKDSGVEWIGKIPAHWNILRNKNLIFEINERCDADTPLPLLSVSEYYGVAPKAEKIDDGKILVRADSLDGYKICKPNDVAMNIMLAWKRAQAVSEYHGIISPAYCIYRKRDDAPLNMDYFHYLIRSDLYTNIFKRYSTGIIESRLRLYPDKFLALHSHVPPVQEQQQIAAFLGEKLAQVDTLIANVQTQIEKLKAYKQSLITEVVTKGLDPTVPMKDSGVEWIGEIACTRTIFRLKYLLDAPMQYGANESGDKLTDDSVRYIRITDITADGNLKDDDSNQFLPLSVAEGYILKDKDVLFARSGGTVGKSFLYRKEYGMSAFAGYLIKAECNQASLLPEYLIYYTQSSLYELWKNMIFIQATIQNIGANKYSNMELPVPSIEEQSSAVEYLGEKCSQIDRLIALKQSKIEKLEQYKKSLIYEYVIGKKEA